MPAKMKIEPASRWLAQSTYNDRLETDLALAGILRRILRGERWCQTGDGALLWIGDSVDLTAGERAAVLQAVREA